MDLGVTEKVRPLVAAVRAMVRDEIIPVEHDYEAEIGKGGDRFACPAHERDLAVARDRGRVDGAHLEGGRRAHQPSSTTTAAAVVAVWVMVR